MPLRSSSTAFSYTCNTGRARSRNFFGSRICCQLWNRQGLSLSAVNHRNNVLALIAETACWESWCLTISARLQRLSAIPFSFGRLHARAVACARTSEGKTHRRSRSRQVFQALALVPSPSPFLQCPVGTPCLGHNLLVAPFRVLTGIQNDPGSHHFDMR